jgi:flagellar basal-body rod protein FlgB
MVGTAFAELFGNCDFSTGKIVNTVPRYNSLAFGEAALKLRTLRHEVLSSNLVNADTPNFKARDIDFKSVLADRLAGKKDPTSLGLDRTHRAHIAIPVTTQGPERLYRVPVQPSVDGNTVDPDVERGHFVKNAFFTESALTFLGSTIRGRLSAITGQPS